MDLREKPGKVQTVLEVLMRIRLISIIVLIVATLAIVSSRWQDVGTLPVVASGCFSEWLAYNGIEKVWETSQFLVVTGIATVVLFSVFGRIYGGVASVVSIAFFIGSLILVGGYEEYPHIFFGIFSGIALILLLFAKASFACGLFPFALGWLFLTCLIAVLQPSLEPASLTWAVLSCLGLVSSMALSVVTGKYLSEGVPQAGAIVKAAKQLVAPIVACSIMAVCAVAYDMPVQTVAASAGQAGSDGNAHIWGAILYFFVFNIWFFVILFPIMTFAPWERLRSGSRRVEMKDKKKAGAKKASPKGKKK